MGHALHPAHASCCFPASFQLDYVDIVFCHRPDLHTPIEETVRAMNHVIDRGMAFYWGTSEWSAAVRRRCPFFLTLDLRPPPLFPCNPPAPPPTHPYPVCLFYFIFCRS